MAGIGPGTVLANRYRLDDLLEEANSAWIWRATDLVLVRDVSVRFVLATDPRAVALLDAARTSSAITGMGLLRVLDADTHVSDGGVEIAFVVIEWCDGDSLGKRLAEDVLQPRLAAQVVRDVAATLADAHVQGLAHGRLLPEEVFLVDGQVKVTGLVVDAVLHGRNDDGLSEHESDIHNLASLLYAGLTGRWPGSSGASLPEAPTENGAVLHARQVRAGVPTQLDRICDTVLNGPHPGAPPIETAHEIRSALSDFLGDTVAVMPLGRPGTYPDSYPDPFSDPDATQVGLPAVGSAAEFIPAAVSQGQSVPAPAPYVPARYGLGSTTAADREIPDIFAPHPPVTPQAEADEEEDWEYWEQRGTPWGRWIAALVAVAAVALVGFFVWQVLGGGGDDTDPTGPPVAAEPEPPEAVTPAGVTTFDPYGDNKENDKSVGNVIDGDSPTVWTTERYRQGPDITKIKQGVGLLIDLGETRKLREAHIELVGGPHTVAFLVSAEDAAPTNTEGLTPFGETMAEATDTATVYDEEGVSARWVVVWFTAVPESERGFVGTVAEVGLKATPSAVSERTDDQSETPADAE